jgi:pSer/pThr/pTyr-binding forkhead associated (FHA) protein
MTDDRTTPMRQWPQQGASTDDQETVFSDSENITPPTFPLGDQGRAGAAGPTDPGFGQTMLIAGRPTPVFAWLVTVDGPNKGEIGKVHTLRADTTTMGRVQGNHIVLGDETCSAQHARIRAEATEGEEAAFVLYDMGSRNGTFVGDKKTYQDEENRQYRHELQDGEYLLLGETTLVFKRI